jgi:hypothetical protein
VHRGPTLLACLVVFLYVANIPVRQQDAAAPKNAAGHHLFAWTGDENKKGMDSLG